MKTFRLFSIAALALAMAACSNEDSALENAAPAQQQGAMKFTATLAAPGSGATTRTTYTEVTSGADAGKINVAWKAGDQIYLFDEEEGQECTATVGTLAGDGSATISGAFDSGVEAGEDITATYPASAKNDDFNAKFASQAGTLAYIQDNLDYRKGTSTISVDGDQATLATALQMESQIAIWKLTLQDNAATPAALSATKVTIKNGSTVIAATTDITATSAVYLALNLKSGNISGADITIEATVGSDTYTYSKSGVSLAKGKYYQSTVTMAKMAAATNLSTISSDYEVKNGEVLTGTLASNVKITVADGATVTLKDADISGTDNSLYLWAGITCSGDATIILEGTNTLKGFYENYPGIYVPEGKTFTIQGTGTLNASSNGWGAGIGGDYYGTCGNIVINSGTITATGGGDAAGIGGGSQGTCGNITISGGTITATGGQYGAGIGSGYQGSCGNIEISGGTITATGGDNAAGIGGGCTGSCGNIEISGGTVTATGGTFAAGIGGGVQNDTCGTITITSGVTSVEATAGEYAPNSIGKGDSGEDITVNIDAGANVILN